MQTPDAALLVILYAKMNRMRILSSPEVVQAAEHSIRRIVNIYSNPPVEISTTYLQAMHKDKSIDALSAFNEACRAEFDSLRGEQLAERQTYEIFSRRRVCD
jgi:hypothetical protein